MKRFETVEYSVQSSVSNAGKEFGFGFVCLVCFVVFLRNEANTRNWTKAVPVWWFVQESSIVNQKSIIESRFLILDSCKDQVSSVNLLLTGAV